MAKRMLVDATHPEEIRVAVVSGNKLEELDFEIASRKQLKGNIYLAKVTRVEPSLQAAFVEYGGNRHGFLAFSEIHPDYYRIPVADREALLAQERAEAERAERAYAASEERRSRRGRRGETTDAEGTNGGDYTASETGAADEGAPDYSSRDFASQEFGNQDFEGRDFEGQDFENRDFENRDFGNQDLSGQDYPAEGEAPTGDDTPPGYAEAGAFASEPPGRETGGNGADDDGPNGDERGGEAMPASYDMPERSEPWQPSRDESAGEERAAAFDDGQATDSPGSDEASASADAEIPAPSYTVETVGGSENGVVSAGAADAVEEEDEEEEEEERRRRPRPLRSYKIQEVIKRRQILLVQVVKEERGNKGAALTTYLSLPGRYCVLMPNTGRGGGISRKITNPQDRKRLKEMLSDLDIPDGMAVILRTAGMERSKPEIKRDLEYLLRLWDTIRDLTLQSTAPALIYEEANLIKRSIRDLYSNDLDEVQVEGEHGYRMAKDFMRMLMPSHTKKVQQYRDETIPLFFRYQVETQIDAIHSPVVQLRSGGYIVINQTEALVAIDVNSGRSTKERNIEETAFKTNLEAADEVARQLRLRDLAGLIVIDFIDMEDARNNAAVERRLKEAMKTDRARIQLGRISPFGLLELSRQRLRPSLIETNFEKCPHCHGTGMIRSLESAALYVLRAIEEEGIRKRSSEITVSVATRIALYILNQKREALGDIERRYGFRVFLFGDDSLTPPEYRLERIKARPVGEDVQPVISTERILAETDRALERETVEDEADEVEEDAETEATGSQGAPAQAEDGNGERRGRRRRRRRGRRGEDRGEFRTEATNGLPAEPAGDQQDGDEPDGEEIEAAEDAVAAEGDAAGRDQAFEEDENGRKRRRRGKRGGRRRRNRGEFEGQEEGAAFSGDDVGVGEGDDAGEAAEAPASVAASAPPPPPAPVPAPAPVHDDLGDVFADLYPPAEETAVPAAEAAVPADPVLGVPEPASAAEPVAEEEPAKPKRRAPARRKKAEAAADAGAPAVSEAAPPAPEPAPAAEAAAAAAEAAPAKPKRRAPARRKKADGTPDAPAADATDAAVGANAPVASEASLAPAAPPAAEPAPAAEASSAEVVTPPAPPAPPTQPEPPAAAEPPAEQPAPPYEVIQDAPRPERAKKGWWNKLLG
ncbi:Rne/Rng family ribonuclease [Arenibaculum pallidiluteum]|uniref:Rne/Rng family ribonuclease n=1 Tax=Arenibaculum pallidiluteum TaxID=2812559 RepID=UPI001F36A234|nr:ribonuclease E/G [Arenibaculum pallidiluteum]